MLRENLGSIEGFPTPRALIRVWVWFLVLFSEVSSGGLMSA